MSATAGTIVDAVLQDLNEDPDDPRYWSRAEILSLVWEGLVELNLTTAFLTETVTLELDPNSVHATPPHIAILHIRIENRSLQKVSINDLDGASPRWEAESTVTAPRLWAPIGAGLFILQPRTTGMTRTEYEVDVLSLPDELDEDTDLPINDEYVEAVADYAFSVARLKEGGPEFQQGVEHYKNFLAFADAIGSRMDWKRMPAWTYSPYVKLADAVPRRKP